MTVSTHGTNSSRPTAGRGLLWVIVASGALLLGAIILVQSGGREVDSSKAAGIAPRGGRQDTRPFSQPSPSGTPTPVGREAVVDPHEPKRLSAAELEQAVGSFLNVLVLDNATGAPLPDIELSLFSERPRLAGYGHGISNQAGRVQFSELSENLYLVASRRTPPFAEGLGVVWVADRSQQELVLRLSHGGSIAGRVVDDEGQPLEGAEITVSDGTGFSRAILGNKTLNAQSGAAVHSDRDGRFQVDAVRSEPKGVWLIDGEVRQEKLVPVRITARLQSGRDSISSPVDEGRTARVEDMVIDRPRSLSGIVVDERGRRLPNVFVSVNKDRIWTSQNEGYLGLETQFTKLMQDPSFLIEFEEARTDESGRFELHTRSAPYVALVRGPNGTKQLEELGHVAPGESLSGIELVLKTATSLSLRLVDEEGRPISPTPIPQSRPLQYSSSFLLGNQVHFVPIFSAGAPLSSTRNARRSLFSEDGHYAPSFQFDLGQVAELLIFADGYHMQRLTDLTQALASSTTLKLKPLPRVRISLSIGEDWPRKEIYQLRQLLDVFASSIAPTQLPDSASTRTLKESGLGSNFSLHLGVSPKLLTLPVLREGEYWVYLVPSWIRNGKAFDLRQVAGPFSTTSNEVHEIELTAEFLAHLAMDSDGAGPKIAPGVDMAPYQPTEAGAGQVALRLTNATSGDAITDVRVWLRNEETSTSRFALPHGEPGSYLATELVAGTWQPTLRQGDYEPVEWEEVVLAPGEHLDLGNKMLVPRPRLRGHLLLSDGAKAPERSSLVITDLNDKDYGTTYGETDADGYFDIPFASQEVAHFYIRSQVTAFNQTQFIGQEFCLDLEEWNGELRLQPWRHVEFILEGIAPEKQFEPCELSLVPDHCATASHPAFESKGLRTTEPQLDGRRRFRTVLSSGTYTPRVSGGTIAVKPIPFAVLAGEGVQEVRLTLQH